MIQIVAWDSMQHYKNRNPPWIRLYADMLDRPDFVSMSRSDFGVYCTLSLLASKWDNAIPHNPEWLERYRVSARSIDTLRDAGLIEIVRAEDVRVQPPANPESASNVLAARLQTATSESESESESEAEPDTEPEPDTPPADGGSPEGVSRPRAPHRAARRMPSAWQPSEELLAWASRECPLVNLAEELEAIRDYEFGKPRSDWDATVRNWMRREQKQFAKRAAPQRETRFQRMQRRLDEI